MHFNLIDTSKAVHIDGTGCNVFSDDRAPNLSSLDIGSDSLKINKYCFLYANVKVTLLSSSKMLSPLGSSIDFYRSDNSAHIYLDAQQIMKISKGLELNKKHVFGAVVHHELGHLEDFLANRHFSTDLGKEISAWESARTTVPNRLPLSWKGVPSNVYRKVSMFALNTYDHC